MHTPRLAEILNVEVNEPWTVENTLEKYRVTEDGHLEHCLLGSQDWERLNLYDTVIRAINNPDCINTVNRWTDLDARDASAIRYVFKDAVKVKKEENRLIVISDDGFLAQLKNTELIPSLGVGETAYLFKIQEGSYEA